MNRLNKIQQWGDQHHPQWLDYFRIALGLMLIWKGVEFTLNLRAFTNFMNDVSIGSAASISLLAHAIIFLHLVGGFLITVGSRTRLFCLLNLPILVYAVFFINFRADIFRPYTEIWLSGIVLIGLICFLIEGDGKISIEHEKEVTT